jgi:DNA-binding NarL/FixJ family response regulator
MTTRLVIAHRSAFIRDIVRIAGLNRDVVVVGETDRADELAKLCITQQPDVAFVEATLAVGDELESVLPDILSSGVRVVVVSADHSPLQVTSILALGASGFLRHDTSPDQVIDAIEAVAAGAAALGPQAAATILEEWRHQRPLKVLSGVPLPALSAREQEVLAAMAEGISDELMARRLGLALKTLENHKIRIFLKLGVRRQDHAVALAKSRGLLGAPPVTSV